MGSFINALQYISYSTNQVSFFVDFSAPAVLRENFCCVGLVGGGEAGLPTTKKKLLDKLPGYCHAVFKCEIDATTYEGITAESQANG
jgi:hypothetical protein